jgi:hypothetical protein
MHKLNQLLHHHQRKSNVFNAFVGKQKISDLKDFKKMIDLDYFPN